MIVRQSKIRKKYTFLTLSSLLFIQYNVNIQFYIKIFQSSIIQFYVKTISMYVK